MLRQLRVFRGALKQDYITFYMQSNNMTSWAQGKYRVVFSSNGKEYGHVDFTF